MRLYLSYIYIKCFVLLLVDLKKCTYTGLIHNYQIR